jgi:hypothetical protein
MSKNKSYKNYKKNPKKGKYAKKSKYPNTRAIAIQRMDLVPRQRVMKCVFDESYLIVPNGAKLSNTVGLCFNLTNLFDGPSATIPTPGGTPAVKVPFWGSYNNTDTTKQSGQSYSAKPYGFTRFIGDGGTTNDAPYRNYMVLGGKYNLRVEQVHKTSASAPESQDLAKLVAIVTRFGRTDTNALSAEEQLSTWQNHRGIKQANMTALVSSGSNRPSTSGNQQIRMSGKFSAKKWFDVKDIKDNLNRLGGSFNDTGTYIPPEEDCFLQMGMFDRIQAGDPTGYVLPNIMVRFRYEAVVLCTETNQLNNIDV